MKGSVLESILLFSLILGFTKNINWISLKIRKKTHFSTSKFNLLTALSGRSLVSAEDSSDVFVSGLGSSAHDHHILPRIVGNITKIPELGHDVIVHLVDVAGDDDSSPEASQDGCDAAHGAEADCQLQHLKEYVL